MPWIVGKSKIKFPDHYSVPSVSNINGQDKVKKYRARYANLAQEMKKIAKDLGKAGHFKEAKVVSDVAKDNQRFEKAFDFVIKWLDGHPEYAVWKSPHASRENADKLDFAFSVLDSEVELDLSFTL
mgnify:CR=1 FL=1